MDKHEEFIERVSADARNQLTDVEHSELWVDHNIDAIYDALVELKKDVEMQMTNFNARIAYEKVQFQKRNEDESTWDRYYAQELHWRARALKFLRSLETRISEARQAKRERSNDERLDNIFAESDDSVEDV